MRIVIIGCGNLLIEDDSIGIKVVRELKKLKFPDFVTIIEAGTPGLGLIDLMEGFDRAIIVDAVVSGAPVGTIHEFTDKILPPKEFIPFSLHGFNIVDAIQFGKKFQSEKMPMIEIVGVEVRGKRNFDTTSAMDFDVSEIVDVVLKMIGKENSQSASAKDNADSSLI